VYNSTVRTAIILLVFLLAAVLVVLSFGELESILATLQQARPLYVLLGAVLVLLWMLALGGTYRSVFTLLGLRETHLALSEMSAASYFVNVVAPSAGLGGVAMFTAEAQRRGHPPGRAAAAAALVFFFDQVAFLFVLALGLMVLFRRDGLGAGEITASLIMLAIAATYGAILYLGYRSEQRLAALLERLAAALNTVSRLLIRRDYLSTTRARGFAHEISSGLASVSEQPRRMLRPFLWGLAGKGLLMLVLLCTFRSFGVPYSAGTIIAGFALVFLFTIVSITPAGIGVVEGIMPLVLTSLRVDPSQAVIITIVYRALTFWLPLGVGAIAFRTLHRAVPLG